MTEFEEYTFPNGIRVLHKQVENTKIAHCGFILNIGSRDEKPHQIGIAHFWEHMAFKGTKKRKAYHILNRLDSVGGEVNAYTTKEKICFYASLLDEHFEKAVDLLSDITFNSVFPAKEIEKERSVILEEMSMYKDDPSDAIQDEFDEVIFGDHPLGYNILGTKESVRAFHKVDFDNFIRENLDTEEVIFSSVSKLPFKKVIRIVGKYLEEIPRLQAPKNRQLFTGYSVQQVTKTKQISQSHCAIGTTSFPQDHENRIPFFMLVNLLGGPGMNSRLNLAIREKYGFVYGIDAHVTSFQDTGLFAIHFATETETLKRCRSLVNKELKKLREKPLGSLQLHAAKQQIMGQLAMSDESNLGFMLMMGKSMLDLGRIESLNSIFEQIKAVDAKKIMELSNEIFTEEKLSSLTFMPDPEFLAQKEED
ncbi:M16 family metallopeptidase [Flexithrix dorotheae]|uniref:M16 family metallopeptidase n=1 Tax=Flexithrix dorotheae TaxID=70993 RepID=UPI000376FF1B|nr:pitrilysin family protein [Flexithrix dorotheae]